MIEEKKHDMVVRSQVVVSPEEAALHGLKELPMKLTCLDEPPEMPSTWAFIATCDTQIGKFAITLRHGLKKDGGADMSLRWFPSGAGKTGKALFFEHDLNRDDLMLAIQDMKVEGDRYSAGYDWREPWRHPAEAEKYKLVMGLLLPEDEVCWNRPSVRRRCHVKRG